MYHIQINEIRDINLGVDVIIKCNECVASFWIVHIEKKNYAHFTEKEEHLSANEWKTKRHKMGEKANAVKCWLICFAPTQNHLSFRLSHYIIIGLSAVAAIACGWITWSIKKLKQLDEFYWWRVIVIGMFPLNRLLCKKIIVQLKAKKIQ